MYASIIKQLIQTLQSLQGFLDKAEQHAVAKKFDVNVLMASTLAPDMKPFTYQVTSACNYLKQAAAWLSGTTLPKHEDNERTIGEIRDRIRATVDFAAGIPPEQFAGAGERRMVYSWKPGFQMEGQTYVLQMAMPNVFFHVAMAYAILRNNGVDVGKMDYLQPLDFAPVARDA